MSEKTPTIAMPSGAQCDCPRLTSHAAQPNPARQYRKAGWLISQPSSNARGSAAMTAKARPPAIVHAENHLPTPDTGQRQLLGTPALPPKIRGSTHTERGEPHPRERSRPARSLAIGDFAGWPNCQVQSSRVG